MQFFPIHTPSNKTKMKRISCTNKKNENEKLETQQPSLLSFMFLATLKCPKKLIVPLYSFKMAATVYVPDKAEIQQN